MSHLIDNRRSRRALRVALALLSAAVLAGCGADHDELQQWMEQQRREVKPNVAPLSAAEEIRPAALRRGRRRSSPSARRSSRSRSSSDERGSRVRCWPAELNRRKEPLEAYPLDSMSMVGSVDKQGQPFALLRVDNLLYQVKVGDYLGQNYGRDPAHHRDRCGAARNRAGRCWRMDRAQQYAATCRSGGAMKNSKEKRIMMKWRAWGITLVLAIGAPAAALAQERDPVDHQQPAGGQRGGSHRTERAADGRAGGLRDPDAAAHRDRPAGRGQCASVARRSRSTRATCDRSTWPRPATARAWCSTSSRPRPTARSLRARRCWSSSTATVRGNGGCRAAAAPAAPRRWPTLRRRQNREQQPLRDIDFRRGADGAGRVIVSLPSNQVGVDIRQQGQAWWSSSCARPCPTACAGAST